MKFERLTSKSRVLQGSIDANQVNSLRTNITTEVSYRVFDGGMIGVAGQIGEYDERELRDRAINNLSFGITYPCSLSKNERIMDTRKHIIYENQFVPTVRSFIKKLSDRFPNIVFSQKVRMTEIEREYINCEGANLVYKGNGMQIVLYIKDKNSNNQIDSVFVAEDDCFDEQRLLALADAELGVFDKRVEYTGEKLPVIVETSFLNFLINDMIAERYGSNAGLLAGKLHNKIFADSLNVCIDRSEKSLLTPFFDIEGTVLDGLRFDLIKDGVLNGLLTTRRSAAQFGLKVCGSANAAFDGVPVVGIGGLSVLPTHQKVSDIAKRAIYLKFTAGSDITPQGDIGMPVMLAYLVEDGKIVARLPELMASGNVFDVLGKNFLGVAKGDWDNGRHSDPFIVANMELKPALNK